QAAGRGRRLRVGRAGGGRGGQGSLARLVPGGVVGVDREGVRGATGEARGRVARGARTPGRRTGACDVGVVSRRAAVVARRRPAAPDVPYATLFRAQAAGRGRRLRVGRAGGGRGGQGSLARLVPGGVVGVDREGVRGATGEARGRV